MIDAGLPSGWAKSTLSSLVGSDGLFADGDWVESKDQDPDGEVRLTQLADIGDGVWRDRSNRFLTAAKATELHCSLLEPGDVLVARMPDPLGRACVFPGAPQPCVTVVDVAILRPGRSSVDPHWLAHWINAPQIRAEIDALQAGTTRKRISRKNLAGIELPVPPLAEQRRIVEAIEAAFSKLDAGVDYLRAARQRLRRLAEVAVWSSLLRSDQIVIAESGLPVLPAHWGWQTLGALADVAGGVTKDAKKQTELGYVEVPYLRVANVQRGWLDLDVVTTIRVAPERAKSLRLEPGDVLFNEGGDRDKLGRGWVWEGQIDNCIHQNHVFRARIQVPGVQPKYVSLWGNTFGRRWFEHAGKQTTNLASVSMTSLRAFPVPVPPPDEQAAIVAEVEAQQSIVSSSSVDIEHQLRRADALRRSVLAAAFSGNLVRQDPADEPAELLIKRIAPERPAVIRQARTRRARHAAEGVAR